MREGGREEERGSEEGRRKERREERREGRKEKAENHDQEGRRLMSFQQNKKPFFFRNKMEKG